jgi:hypothetical protein
VDKLWLLVQRRNIYGQTARKTQAVVAMSAAMAEDQLLQASESAMADLRKSNGNC